MEAGRQRPRRAAARAGRPLPRHRPADRRGRPVRRGRPAARPRRPAGPRRRDPPPGARAAARHRAGRRPARPRCLGRRRCASRAATPLPCAVPVSIDLSAEATGFRRPAAAAAARRLLPGRRAAHPVRRLGPAAGRHRPSRSPARPPGRAWSSPCISPAQTLRETLAALGLPLAGTDPARLRTAEGRFKLVAGGQRGGDLRPGRDARRRAACPAAGVVRRGRGRRSASASRSTGWISTGCCRHGRMPAGLILAGLDRLRPQPAPGRGPVAWRELTGERATLDAALENGRRHAAPPGAADRGAGCRGLRRGSARRAAARPGCQPGISGAGAALMPLLPAEWAGLAPLLAQPLALRLSGGGRRRRWRCAARAISARCGPRRPATLDATRQARGNGTLTLRHPGAPRLLAPLLGPEAGGLARRRGPSRRSPRMSQRHATGRFTRGADDHRRPSGPRRRHLCGRGQMTLALDGARPRLTGASPPSVLPLPALRCAGPSRSAGPARRAGCRAGGGGRRGSSRPAAGAGGGRRHPEAGRRRAAAGGAAGQARRRHAAGDAGGGRRRDAAATGAGAQLADATIASRCSTCPSTSAPAGWRHGEAGRGRPQHGGADGDAGGHPSSASAMACWSGSTLPRCRPPARCRSLARPKRRCARPWPAAPRPSSGWRRRRRLPKAGPA